MADNPGEAGPEILGDLADGAVRTRLAVYGELLVRWNRRINLVGPATIGALWRRHMLDSAQLAPLIPAGAQVLVDLGSGAGFPGLVLAAQGMAEVHLVESDRRKAVFLGEAARAMGLGNVRIHAVRIDAAIEGGLGGIADVLTARALAPLPDLLGWAALILKDSGTALFLKGETAAQELTAAEKRWKMASARHPSRSDPRGCIVEIAGRPYLLDESRDSDP